MNDDQPIAAQLSELKDEHRKLDRLITELIEAGSADQLELARLKKQKLRLKDLIQQVSDFTTPDISA
ncbi:MAG: YdcH family protein [Sphingomonas sp.]|nr:YdcH family protein [Sphingomonas sp.]